jgi:hypothetical protein
MLQPADLSCLAIILQKSSTQFNQDVHIFRFKLLEKKDIEKVIKK